MKTMKIIFLINALAVFFVFNWMIAQKEQVLKNGQTVLLELAPRDPRSLMQGDYMELNYKIIGSLLSVKTRDMSHLGKLVLRLDDKQVAQFVRFHRDETLNQGELLLVYRRSGLQVRLGAESFFFQEGQAKLYQKARYGELKVAPDGESVLVGLRDEKFNRLGPDKK